MYERLLEVTTRQILAGNEKVVQRYEGAVPPEYVVGSFVLVSYLMRRLANCCREGPDQ